MPTYEYLCSLPKENGGHGEFEAFHSIRDDAKLIECPHCREAGIETPVERLLSAGGRGVVELNAQEMKDKIKGDAKQFSKDVHSSEKLYSNILGESKYNSLQQNIDRSKKERY